MSGADIIKAVLAFRSAHEGMSGSEVRARIRESREFRERIAALHEAVYHTKLNTSCGDCYVDAYALLMRDKLNDMEQRSERQFELLAGVLLRDTANGRGEMNTSHHNLTDERALYHLAVNPSCIRYFAKYPENWRELAAAAFSPNGTRVVRKAECKAPAMPANVAAGAQTDAERKAAPTAPKRAAKRKKTAKAE